MRYSGSRAGRCRVTIGAGIDVAVENADSVPVRNDLRDVADSIGLSKRTYAKRSRNLVRATGYNTLLSRPHGGSPDEREHGYRLNQCPPSQSLIWVKKIRSPLRTMPRCERLSNM
ncbi:MAG: hypothetical protein WC294_11165 [Methanoregula sp.]